MFPPLAFLSHFPLALPRLLGGTACTTGPPRYSTTAAAAARACMTFFFKVCVNVRKIKF